MNKLLTVNGLAKHFEVNRTTIYRWILNGMPYTTTPSGSKRFDIETINEWSMAKGAK